MFDTLTDDEQLMQRIAAQDRRAMEELYDRYGKMVYGFAYKSVSDKYAAEEITQDVFTKVWKNASAYDPAQAKLATWLLTITRRIAIDQFRRKERRPQAAPTIDDVLVLFHDTSLGPDGLAEVQAVREVVSEAMKSLPSDQRIPIERMYYQGLTQREIAEQLDVPIGTVKSRIRLGLARLRDKLSSVGLGEAP